MQKNSKISSGNIILVGMMGSGKSTVGRALAKHLGKQFIDSDQEIKQRTGVAISHIFDLEGEMGFRARETAELKTILDNSGCVLATGGGAILAKDNRELMQSRGIVIYLQATVQELWQRTKHDKGRPLLQGENPMQTLDELNKQRDDLYQSIADITLQTGRQSVQNLVQQIERRLKGYEDKMEERIKMGQTLRVELGARSYQIHVGEGVSIRPELILPYIPNKRVAIVTNTTVAPLYLKSIQDMLNNAGVASHAIILPDGESYKTLESMTQIFDALLRNKCERNTPLIALGGGVIGDMTGFAAATYLRGVPFIQIPTTLLSQVDSSVGGKTGVNHPLGKNMIGAFYQPKVVLADINTLATLPDREFSAGLAEVIKYGLIRDTSFLEWLELSIEAIMARDAQALITAIAWSCRIKAEMVGTDELEGGLRAILNLGHTFGHAIESGMGYGVWLHGEAVAAGTVMAADLSCRMGWISNEDLERVIKIIERARLPIAPPKMTVEMYMKYMGMDKKVEDGKIRFVLLKQLGNAVVEANVPADLLQKTLEKFIHD